MKYKFISETQNKIHRFLSCPRTASKQCGDSISFFLYTRLFEPDQIFRAQKYGEAAQIGQTFHTPLWKICLKHSAAEFQLIQQFWLQLHIVL